MRRGEAFCKEVVGAMDARLKSKNPKTVALTIALLDTMEKNCNGCFHKAVCQKEFLDNLFKIVGGDCNQAADDFLDWLNRFSNNHGVKFTVSVSGDPGLATDGMQKYL